MKFGGAELVFSRLPLKIGLLCSFYFKCSESFILLIRTVLRKSTSAYATHFFFNFCLMREYNAFYIMFVRTQMTYFYRKLNIWVRWIWNVSFKLISSFCVASDTLMAQIFRWTKNRVWWTKTDFRSTKKFCFWLLLS
jgi:hypothetical protein